LQPLSGIADAGKGMPLAVVQRTIVRNRQHGACFRILARQHVPALFADHHVAIARGEERHQAQLSLLPADRIPRNPHAVGRAEFRRAVVVCELLGREDVLPVGLAGVRPPVRVVEGVHDQLAGNADRLVLLVVKVQPAAEAPRGRLVRLVVNGVRPEGDHLRGLLDRFLVFLNPRQALRQVDALASGERQQRRDDGCREKQAECVHGFGSVVYL